MSPTSAALQTQSNIPSHPFVKMHGLGNDFIILDARAVPFVPTCDQIRRLADRRYGIGCDQLIVLLEDTNAPKADTFMRIFNADGSQVEACGNATRCVGYYLAKDSGQDHQKVRTVAGILETYTHEGETRVILGAPTQDWQELNLAREVDCLYLPLGLPHLPDPAGVGVGNPHMIFFLEALENLDIDRLGRELAKHTLYPHGTNVEFVQILSRTCMRMRVWERGTGVTPACATGACASVVAGVSRGLLDMGAECEVMMDGGSLFVNYDGQTVSMRGPVAHVYQGTFLETLFD